MHRGLPLVESIESVSFSSSESKFGTSVNSVMLVGLYAVHFRTRVHIQVFVIFRNVDLDFRSIFVWFLDEFVRSVD